MRNATYVTLRLIFILAIAACAIPMAQAQEAAREQSIDQSKSASELKADFMARYRLDEEAAKALADIVADNFRHIREGEVGKDDLVVHLQVLNPRDIIRVLGNDIRLAPAKPFIDLTDGETELTTANHEKVIKALYDTTDVNLWLRQPDMGEFLPLDLQRYRKHKSILLKETLAKVGAMITGNAGEAERLFKVFNTDIKQLAVPPSREAFRILLTTAVYLADGERILGGSDEARKLTFSAFLLNQIMARAVLTRRDIKKGGVAISFGKAGQNMTTQIIPTEAQFAELQYSENLTKARGLAVKAMRKKYESELELFVSMIRGEKAQARIATGEAIIAEGKRLDMDSVNITRIGEIRRNINTRIRGLIASTSKIEQQKHIANINQLMRDFFKVRAELQAGSGMTELIHVVNVDIAIIRGHPALKTFDKELVPFSLDGK